jgi:hypothetical protein
VLPVSFPNKPYTVVNGSVPEYVMLEKSAFWIKFAEALCNGKRAAKKQSARMRIGSFKISRHSF